MFACLYDDNFFSSYLCSLSLKFGCDRHGKVTLDKVLVVYVEHVDLIEFLNIETFEEFIWSYSFLFGLCELIQRFTIVCMLVFAMIIFFSYLCFLSHKFGCDRHGKGCNSG